MDQRRGRNRLFFLRDQSRKVISADFLLFMNYSQPGQFKLLTRFKHRWLTFENKQFVFVKCTMYCLKFIGGEIIEINAVHFSTKLWKLARIDVLGQHLHPCYFCRHGPWALP